MLKENSTFTSHQHQKPSATQTMFHVVQPPSHTLPLFQTPVPLVLAVSKEMVWSLWIKLSTLRSPKSRLNSKLKCAYHRLSFRLNSTPTHTHASWFQKSTWSIATPTTMMPLSALHPRQLVLLRDVASVSRTCSRTSQSVTDHSAPDSVIQAKTLIVSLISC